MVLRPRNSESIETQVPLPFLLEGDVCTRRPGVGTGGHEEADAAFEERAGALHGRWCAGSLGVAFDEGNGDCCVGEWGAVDCGCGEEEEGDEVEDEVCIGQWMFWKADWRALPSFMVAVFCYV